MINKNEHLVPTINWIFRFAEEVDNPTNFNDHQTSTTSGHESRNDPSTLMSAPENNTTGYCYLRSGRLLNPGNTQPTEPETTSVEPNPAVEPCLPVDSRTSIPDPDACGCPESTPRRTLPHFDTETSFDELQRDSPLFFYNDNMTEGSNALLPSPFYGKPEEDINEFLKNFELWATFRRADRDSRLAALPLLLKEGAAAWYHTQSSRIRESIDDLKRALIERYGPQAAHAWKSTADLWLLKQAKGQSIDDYLTAVLKAGQKIGVGEENLYFIALNGLRPSIRQHVIQHELSSLEDLRQWGRITELSLRDSALDDSPFEATARELAEMKAEIRKLRINVVNPSSRSPSPSAVSTTPQRRVQFQEDSRRTPPQTTFNQRRFFTNQRQTPNRRNQPDWTNQGTPPRCGNCGGKHNRNYSCPAREKTCFYCHRRGHLQSVCRAARSARSQPNL